MHPYSSSLERISLKSPSTRSMMLRTWTSCLNKSHVFCLFWSSDQPEMPMHQIFLSLPFIASPMIKFFKEELSWKAASSLHAITKPPYFPLVLIANLFSNPTLCNLLSVDVLLSVVLQGKITSSGDFALVMELELPGSHYILCSSNIRLSVFFMELVNCNWFAFDCTGETSRILTLLFRGLGHSMVSPSSS